MTGWREGGGPIFPFEPRKRRRRRSEPLVGLLLISLSAALVIGAAWLLVGVLS